jgi:hypothetical protein
VVDTTTSPIPPPPDEKDQRLWLRWLIASAGAVAAVVGGIELVSQTGWMPLVGLLSLVAGILMLLERPLPLNLNKTVSVGCAVILLAAGLAVGGYGVWGRFRGPHLTEATKLTLCAKDTPFCNTAGHARATPGGYPGVLRRWDLARSAAQVLLPGIARPGRVCLSACGR